MFSLISGTDLLDFVLSINNKIVYFLCPRSVKGLQMPGCKEGDDVIASFFTKNSISFNIAMFWAHDRQMHGLCQTNLFQRKL